MFLAGLLRYCKEKINLVLVSKLPRCRYRQYFDVVTAGLLADHRPTDPSRVIQLPHVGLVRNFCVLHRIASHRTAPACHVA